MRLRDKRRRYIACNRAIVIAIIITLAILIVNT